LVSPSAERRRTPSGSPTGDRRSGSATDVPVTRLLVLTSARLSARRRGRLSDDSSHSTGQHDATGRDVVLERAEAGVDEPRTRMLALLLLTGGLEARQDLALHGARPRHARLGLGIVTRTAQ
jgi:hypothetical protein